MQNPSTVPQRTPSPIQGDVDLDAAIEQLRQKFNVPRVLVDRMLKQESGGNDNAVSPAGAKSRWQIMPSTAKGILKPDGSPINPDDPLDAAYGGLKILSDNYKQFRSGAPSERAAWMRAVAAYHAGTGAVQKDLERGGLGIPDVGDGLINTRDHVYNIFNGTKPEDFEQSQQPPTAISTIPQREGVTSTVREVGAEVPLEQKAAPVTRNIPNASGDAVSSPQTGMRISVPLNANDDAESIYMKAFMRSVSALGFDAPNTERIAAEMTKRTMEKNSGHIFHAGTNTPMTSEELTQLKSQPVTAFSFDDPELIQTLTDEVNRNKPVAEKLGAMLGSDLMLPDAKFVGGMAGKAGAGLGDVAAGGLRIGFTPNLIGQILGARDPFKSTEEALHGQGKSLTKGIDESSQYPDLVRGAQNVGAGFIESAPIMLATGGTGAIPAALAFGTQSALQSAGRGESLPQVALQGGKGAATGALLGAEGAEIPAIIRTGGAGLGSFGIEKATGASNAEALQAGLQTAMLRGVGEAKEYVHVQFGKVRESENQAGVQKGKIRVTDEQGSDHVIIKPSTARNQRAIPLREETSNAVTKGQQSESSVPQYQGAKGVGQTAETGSSDSTVPSGKIQTEAEALARMREAEALPYSNKTKAGLKQKAVRAAAITAAQNQLAEIRARPAMERAAKIESGRYSPTPRFDEFVENRTGQRVDQLSDVEVAGLSNDYQKRYADAPAPSTVRELPPINGISTVPSRDTARVAMELSLGPPLRETVTHANSIRDAVDSSDVESLNRLLDEAGITDADLAVARGEQYAQRSTTVPARTPTGTTAEQVTQIRESQAPEASSTVPRRDSEVARTGERSFPLSAEAAGLPSATNRTYEVASDRTAVDRANKRIADDGMDRVIGDLARNVDPSKDDIVAGQILAHKLTAEGDIERAVNVIDDLSVKLTKAGQQVQAASLISRLSPEGALLMARRRAGRTLTTEEGQTIVEKTGAISDAQKLVSQIQRDYPQIFGENGEVLPAAKMAAKKGQKLDRIGTLQDRLMTMERDARARLAARVGVGKGGEVGASTIPLDIADYAIIGASKLAQKGVTLAQWSADMIREFGEDIKPHLNNLFVESHRIKEEQRMKFLQEGRERSARRAEPDAENIQGVINRRLDAQTALRKNTAELNRTFDDLTKGTAQKIFETVGDVAGLSRAIETTADLSWGFRQGKMAFGRHPLLWLEGFRKQKVALSEARYNQLLSEIELDPDYKYMQRAKLELAGVSSANSSRLATHEEGFGSSHFVQKLPIIRESERAYNAMGDWVKSQWFKARLDALRKSGVDLEAPANQHLLKLEADLINNATGRGHLPMGLDRASPLINQFTYSARFWASRLKMLTLPLDPRQWGFDVGKYGAYPKSVRVEAWKTLAGYYGVVGGQLLLLKAMGAKVGTNPNDPDFLKARIGPVHIDLSAGMVGHLRYIAHVTNSIINSKQGKKQSENQTPMGITGTYLRTKESPNFSFLHDVFLSKKTPEGYGTDYKGDSVYPFGDPKTHGLNRFASSYVVQKYEPMVLSDVRDAYRALDWKGVAGVAPLSILGEGVTVYDPNKKSAGYAPLPQRPSIAPLPRR